MSESSERTLVLRNVRDEDGTMWRAVSVTEDGGLLIAGHDLGPGVEQLFGFREYEFERRLSTGETAALRTLLGVTPDGDVLAAIEHRFESTHDLEDFVQQHGIAGEFWNRIGD